MPTLADATGNPVAEDVADDVRPTAWQERATDLAQWAWDTHVVRTDRFGLYSKTGNPKAFPKKGPEADALKPDHLAQHFYAGPNHRRLGMYSLDPADSTGRVIVIDIDAHDKDVVYPDRNRRYAVHVYDRATRLGFRPLLNSTNGRGGYHLRIVFAGRVDGETLYRFGRWLVSDWSEFDFKIEPEVFPKQERIKREGKGSYGNYARLPGRHHRYDHWPEVDDGKQWLTDAAAVEHVLTVTGDEPRARDGDKWVGGADAVSCIMAASRHHVRAVKGGESKSPAGTATGPRTTKWTTPPGEQPRAWDDSNHNGTWEKTGLFDAGWAWDSKTGADSGYIRRPDKADGEGHSASVGVTTSNEHGWPFLYVFTNAAEHFAERDCLCRSEVFARLKCNGDRDEAARKVAEMGYGDQSSAGPEVSSVNPTSI